MATGGTPPTSSPTPRTANLWHKQALDYVADAVKQLITIAAGVATATAIFVKDLPSIYARVITIVSWIPLFISAIYGTMVLMGLAGVSRRAALGKVAAPTLEDDILDHQQKQFVYFFVGIFLIVVSGILAAFTGSTTDNNAKIINFISAPAPAGPVSPPHVEQPPQPCPPITAPPVRPPKPRRRPCPCARVAPSPPRSSSSTPPSQEK